MRGAPTRIAIAAGKLGLTARSKANAVCPVAVSPNEMAWPDTLFPLPAPVGALGSLLLPRAYRQGLHSAGLLSCRPLRLR